MNSHLKAPTQFIEANGIRFAYRRLGQETGRPLILLGHFRANMDNWDPKITDGLGKSRPVILFSNTGIGLTSGKTPNTIQEMAKDAISFIEALGLSDVDLFGFSMGGFIAQQITLDRPDLVRRLVLSGTGPEGGVEMQKNNPEVTKRASKQVPELEDILYLFFAPSEASQISGKAYWKRIHMRKEDLDTSASTASMQAQSRAIRTWGIPNQGNTRLKEIKQPTLIANGYKDTMVPTINSYILYQNILSSKLILYPDSGHGFLFQFPEEFVTDVTIFLND